MSNSVTLWRRVLLAGVSSLALTPAVAGTLTLPESGTISQNGAAFQVTNTGIGAAMFLPAAPVAIRGIATGANSISILGVNSGSGVGGDFRLTGAAHGPDSVALLAASAGGSTSVEGPYGFAAIFRITNAMNNSAAVRVHTLGNDSHALEVLNNGVSTGAVHNAYDDGGIAGYFEIGNPATTGAQSALLAVSAGVPPGRPGLTGRRACSRSSIRRTNRRR
jgi:hypothetical protein